MTCVGRKHGPTADRVIADAVAFLGPSRAEQRRQAIAALSTVVWKGRTLYTLRCAGTSGKGPHAVNVPIAMCWHLMSLTRFYCPYHAGDAWGQP